MDGELDGPVIRELRRELAELEPLVEEHPALWLAQQSEELDRAMRWYLGNANHLLETIYELDRDGLGLFVMTRDEVPWDDETWRDFVVELGRVWHNFVAGAVTFADHMRLQFRNGQPDDLRAEYEAKLAELVTSHDVVHFVSRARNVLLHGGIFQTNVRWQFTRRERQFEASCRTDLLLAVHKNWWTAKAKSYIQGKAPSLDLREVVEDHVAVVTPMYEWYSERVYEYHYPQYAEFERLSSRIAEIERQLNPDDPTYQVEVEGFDLPRSMRPVRPPLRPRVRKKRKRR